MAIQTWHHGTQSLTWSSVEGKVTSRHLGENRRREMLPEIHISYTVDQQEYELIVDDNFVIETPVIVYYDPQHPESSSYYQGVDRGSMLAYIAVTTLASLAFAAHVLLAFRPDMVSKEE